VGFRNWNQFPESVGIGRNSAGFLPIPSDSGIPEFRTEIRLCRNEITYQHNITNVGEEDGVIPVSDSGIGRNSAEFRNQWNSINLEWVSYVVCRSSSRNWMESIPVRN
jgi:hypothetical protein